MASQRAAENTLGAKVGVEGENRTRVFTGLQPVALPSWRPRQASEPARDSVHHRSPGPAPLGGDGESRTPGTVVRRRSGPLRKTDMRVVSSRGEWRNRTSDLKVTLVFGTSSPPRGALSAGGRGIEPRWPVLETSLIPDRCPWSGRQDSNLHRPRSGRGGRPVDPHPVGVTVRYRSGTFAFTARRAEPLHHGHHGQVEAEGVAPSSCGNRPRALLLSYASRHPTRRPVGRLAHSCLNECPRLESNQRLLLFGQAPSPDRLQGHVVAGVVPGHGHRRLFGCQRAASLRNEEFVRGRGVEPRSAGSKPAGLPLADPRLAFRDEDSNLDFCVQSAAACR
jgi:hypothetical protein